MRGTRSIAPEHQRPAQQIGRARGGAHLGGVRHRMPAVAQGAHAATASSASARPSAMMRAFLM
jgi:hypothetical protein